MSVILLVLGIILFVGLVVLHEFGHFLAARRNGVDVEEFGIGFPPRAWSKHVFSGERSAAMAGSAAISPKNAARKTHAKTKRGFIFSLNWLPIGGFVKLKGENDSATEPGSFGAASFKTKTKIMLAGVGMNLFAAYVIFTALAWLGMPQLIDNQFAIKGDTRVVERQLLVGYVEPGSPADKAGLHTRDRLIGYFDPAPSSGKPEPLREIGFTSFGSAANLPKVTKKYAGHTLLVAYARDGQFHQATIPLKTAKEAKDGGYLGVAPAEFTLTRSTWSAPIQALGLIRQFTVATFQGLGTAISALSRGDGAKASEQVSGPVGIVVVLRDGSLLGYQFVLLIIGLISLSLAIMNVLPIPALDGGRFYVLLLSRIFGRRLSKDMEERIVGTSFVFLLLLIVVITVVDVKRFF